MTTEGTTKGYAVSVNALVARQVAIEAPIAKGWSRSYDGTALEATQVGITQADIYQKFDTAILWQNTAALSRLELILQRSYSFKEDGGGNYLSYTYDNPALDYEDGFQRSYTKTDYKGSYDAVGRINTSRPPVVQGYSQSRDGQGRYNKSYLDQKYALDPWSITGKTVLEYSNSYSWSSNNDAIGVENVVAANGAALTAFTGGPTVIYGAGGIGGSGIGGLAADPTTWANAVTAGTFTTRADAIKQFDEAATISYMNTDYTKSYDAFGTTKGLAPIFTAGKLTGYSPEGTVAITAPVGRGWTVSDDGSSIDPTLTLTGITKSDVFQEFNTDIWKASNQSKMLVSLQRSYSYHEDANWASYTYDNPGKDAMGGFQRSYSETDYTNSYLLSGKVNRGAAGVPTSRTYSQSCQDGWRLEDRDGEHQRSASLGPLRTHRRPEIRKLDLLFRQHGRRRRARAGPQRRRASSVRDADRDLRRRQPHEPDRPAGGQPQPRAFAHGLHQQLRRDDGPRHRRSPDLRRQLELRRNGVQPRRDPVRHDGQPVGSDFPGGPLADEAPPEDGRVGVPHVELRQHGGLPERTGAASRAPPSAASEATTGAPVAAGRDGLLVPQLPR